jgi:hypothetical protein
MRKVVATLLAAVAVSAGAGVAAAPAEAAGTRCVTRHEYYSLHKGMTRARVHHILDTRGRRDGARSRVYRICGTRNWGVHVKYHRSHGRWRLESKWANAQ